MTTEQNVRASTGAFGAVQHQMAFEKLPDLPDVPSALRRAFDATVKDPEFLAEATRAHLDIEPLTGERIQELLDGAYAAPKEIVSRAAALVGPAAQTKK